MRLLNRPWTAVKKPFIFLLLRELACLTFTCSRLAAKAGRISTWEAATARPYLSSQSNTVQWMCRLSESKLRAGSDAPTTAMLDDYNANSSAVIWLGTISQQTWSQLQWLSCWREIAEWQTHLCKYMQHESEWIRTNEEQVNSAWIAETIQGTKTCTWIVDVWNISLSNNMCLKVLSFREASHTLQPREESNFFCSCTRIYLFSSMRYDIPPWPYLHPCLRYLCQSCSEDA